MKSKRFINAVCGLVLLILAGCNQSGPGDGVASAKTDGKKPRLAYVTNGIDPFWNNAAAGVRAAVKEFDVECEVLMPAKGIVDQKRILETLLVQGVDGIAVSPIDARNQVGLINEAARRTRVITQDADAPDSERLCFVGMNNYKAGRAAGRLLKEALPGGGEVMLFVGRMEQLNAQERRQGIIDELLDKPEQSLGSIQFDTLGRPLAGPQFTVVDTRTDNFDTGRAKANAEDAMTAYPNLKGMVGLFAYNTPQCLLAVREAGKLGQIQLVSFDENENVLQGIGEGVVHGTISQQPFLYGFHSVRILAGLTRGDESVLPEGQFFEVPFVEVRKENVEKFWSELRELQAN
jgi:ribose transport system substrate-binding protein